MEVVKEIQVDTRSERDSLQNRMKRASSIAARIGALPGYALGTHEPFTDGSYSVTGHWSCAFEPEEAFDSSIQLNFALRHFYPSNDIESPILDGIWVSWHDTDDTPQEPVSREFISTCLSGLTPPHVAGTLTLVEEFLAAAEQQASQSE